MTDFQASLDAIRRLCVDVSQITPLLDEMLAGLQRTLDGLNELNDSHARNAEAEIRAAQSVLREVRAVWLDDYVRRSEELCRRIES